MNRTEVFNEHRSLLLSIAYRVLGSRADAEDAVQETFLRWQNAPDEDIQTPKAYLTTIVTRFCIDQLRSARSQREVYVGPWLPEPIMTTNQKQPTSNVELAESLTMAFMVLLESLSPVERAAFLLHEVFDYDYKETAEIIGKTEANCRQMIHRAKEHIASRHRRFDPTREETERVTNGFIEATQNGDVSRLMSLFAGDAVLVSDGGGKVRAALNPIHGADAIARFVVGVVKKNVPRDAVHVPAEVNGQPAFVTWIGGQPTTVTILDIRDGLIRNVFIVANPEKLRGVRMG
jgi:RNA polymerase sigma-70 factor (ECF subfamily)